MSLHNRVSSDRPDGLNKSRRCNFIGDYSLAGRWSPISDLVGEMPEPVAVVLAGLPVGVDPGWRGEGRQAVAVEGDGPAAMVEGLVVLLSQVRAIVPTNTARHRRSGAAIRQAAPTSDGA